MTTTIDNNSVLPDATSIDDTDSPYTTSGEDTIQVDTSSGAVTVTLATADLKAGREIRVIDSGLNAGTNSITIQTEGTETINPGSNSSISIAIDGGYEDFFSDGSNWFSSRNRDAATIDNLDGTGLQYESGDIGDLGILQSDDTVKDLISEGDFVGVGPTLSTDDADQFSTTSTSYVQGYLKGRIIWDNWAPANAQTSVITTGFLNNSDGDVRLQVLTDAETIHQQLDITAAGGINLGPTNYTPTTTSSGISIVLEIRTNDGGSNTEIVDTVVQMGVQV